MFFFSNMYYLQAPKTTLLRMRCFKTKHTKGASIYQTSNRRNLLSQLLKRFMKKNATFRKSKPPIARQIGALFSL